MALFTITQTGKTNLPPDSIGYLEFELGYDVVHVFTKGNFTTETIPVYNDPEGDDVSKVKILTLPANGVLLLSAVPVIALDEILMTAIVAGNLTFVPDTLTTTAYTDSITFDISDLGSNSFSGLGTGLVDINVLAISNDPPSQVGDRTENIAYGQSLVITVAMLTSLTTPIYIDPEGDPADKLLITAVPTVGVLKLDGVTVVANQIINFSDIALNKLVYSGDVTTVASTNSGFGFSIADSGSGQFTN